MKALQPLEVRSLALRAGGRPRERLLFEALSFDLHAGQCWVVLGPNGAGKSSLLGAVAGVFPIAAGEVLLQRVPLARWDGAALAAQRAWCPQFWSDPFPATVAETVRLARGRSAWWQVDEVDAEQAQVEAVIERLELRALVAADVRSLSGGERQRVAIATTLLQDAPLLLFDEPASHLDLAHQQLLIDVLRTHAASGGAVVACLHDLNLAWDLATHAILLDGRGAAWAGPRDEVMVPQRLTQAFDVAVSEVEVCGVRRYWVSPQPNRDA